jgi:hypothetical protein
MPGSGKPDRWSVTAAILFVILCVIIIVPPHPKQVPEEDYSVVRMQEYIIFIDLGNKRLYLFENDRCIKEYPVATGKKETPSPIGTWKIISKGSWSGGFGERWMGLNVPWGVYGIHGTNRPGSIGRAASHGCIRMHNRHVRELYNLVPHGTTVIIVEGLFGPFGRGFKPINPGDRGADVFEVQRRLKQLGYYNAYVDGIYGEGMKKAVHSFQRDRDLPVKNTITREDLLEMGFREFE